MIYVRHCVADELIDSLDDGSVRLFLLDPPYYKIVPEKWDRKWETPEAYASWLSATLLRARPKLTRDGSLVFFNALGSHGAHPLFDVVRAVEKEYRFRNWITWRKRRAYGKSHDYLYIREEILWYSVSAERTECVFNKPYTDELRGYAGFDPKYKAHSEYKRVGNVWTEWSDCDPVIEDITELFRPERTAQKPAKLIARLIETHSNPGDLVVDTFAGWGTTVIEALRLGRRSVGCEEIEADAHAANARCEAVLNT